MAIELITCEACKAKNASHRTDCVRCGASISRPTGSKITKKFPFLERLRQLFAIDASTQNSDTIWLNFLEGMKDDIEGTKELKQVVRSFLMPDKISPFKFKANWIVLSRRGLPPLFDDTENINSTPSLRRFSLVTNRPVGYPEWFLAAYPDVASWATTQVDAITVGAEASEAKTLFHNLFGNVSENELLDGDRRIKVEHLRVLINHYRRETGRALECNMRFGSDTLPLRLMLWEIRTEIACGVVIGFVATGWFDRFFFVWIAGLVVCAQVFFHLVLWRAITRVDFRKVMELEDSLTWKLYGRQFLFSTIAALPFSLTGGLIRVFFFT